MTCTAQPGADARTVDGLVTLDAWVLQVEAQALGHYNNGLVRLTLLERQNIGGHTVYLLEHPAPAGVLRPVRTMTLQLVERFDVMTCTAQPGADARTVDGLVTLDAWALQAEVQAPGHYNNGLVRLILLERQSIGGHTECLLEHPAPAGVLQPVEMLTLRPVEIAVMTYTPQPGAGHRKILRRTVDGPVTGGLGELEAYSAQMVDCLVASNARALPQALGHDNGFVSLTKLERRYHSLSHPDHLGGVMISVLSRVVRKNVRRTVHMILTAHERTLRPGDRSPTTTCTPRMGHRNLLRAVLDS